MAKTRDESAHAVAEEFRRLLVRIREDEGSYREMGRKTGLGEDLFARVAGGRSGIETDSIKAFMAVYGARYAVTEDQVLAWSGHRSQDQAGAGGDDLDIPSLVRELTPDLKMADAQLDAGQVATMRNILHEQIGMLIRLLKEGKLPASEYARAGDGATRK